MDCGLWWRKGVQWPRPPLSQDLISTAYVSRQSARIGCTAPAGPVLNVSDDFPSRLCGAVGAREGSIGGLESRGGLEVHCVRSRDRHTALDSGHFNEGERPMLPVFFFIVIIIITFFLLHMEV